MLKQVVLLCFKVLKWINSANMFVLSGFSHFVSQYAGVGRSVWIARTDVIAVTDSAYEIQLTAQ
jgi:hypothetical protein